MELLGYLILGVAVAAFGTLVGIGGGLILVPLFILVFHWEPNLAVGTSLVVVFFNAISGTVAYMRQKKVYYDAGIRFALATLPGAFLGSYAVAYIPEAEFKVFFGATLMVMAALMFWRNHSKGAPNKGTEVPKNYNRTAGVLLSLGVGFLSSILGIGGGIIHVPAMVYLLAFPAHIATATSHFVLAISSMVGVFSHFLLHNILIKEALMIGVGAVLGAQLGAKMSLKVKSKAILSLLAFCLFGLGARLVFTAGAF